MSNKKLPAWATTVTPLSKTLALSMLVILPILGFYYGMYYQRQLDLQTSQQKTVPVTSQPANGTITCTSTADCPMDYTCAQAGPIVAPPNKPHKTCWKNGSAMPL